MKAKQNKNKYLTAVLFETGAKSVTTKSRNPTICGWGGPFHSYLTHSWGFDISAFLKVIHAPKNRIKGEVPLPNSHLFWGVLGAWMTFKKPEMDKTLRNGLSMSEMDPFNHKWLDFVI